MKINNETKIGIMVSIAIGIMVFMTIKSGKLNLSNEGYNLKVHFRNIDGVNLNSPVMVNGYEVGMVEDIQVVDRQDETMVELTLWVQADIKLRQGTKAYVKNLGFMGEKYVGLISSGKALPFLKTGDIIEGKDPQNFEEIVRNAKDISVEVKEISTQLNKMLVTNSQKIDEILTNVNSTVDNLSSISGSIDERLNVNGENFDEILTNLRGVSSNLEEMSRDLKKNPWKIMYRSKKSDK